MIIWKRKHGLSQRNALSLKSEKCWYSFSKNKIKITNWKNMSLATLNENKKFKQGEYWIEISFLFKWNDSLLWKNNSFKDTKENLIDEREKTFISSGRVEASICKKYIGATTFKWFFLIQRARATRFSARRTRSVRNLFFLFLERFFVYEMTYSLFLLVL